MPKLAFPLFIVALSLVPDEFIHEVIFGVLSLPFRFIYHVPFVMRDKPWILSPFGAIATALLWAFIVYFLTCCFVRQPRIRNDI